MHIVTYTYDANGNLISVSGSYESTEYAYNDEGRLVSVTVTKNGEKTVTTYEYDSLGNRTAKTVDSVRTEYVNDITGSLTMVLCEITEGSVTTYTYGHELISMNSGKEGIRYYLSDGHSDVRLLADNKGIITDIYLYDAYGVRLNHTGESENSMQYLGQQYDERTKLYNMRARYMSPDTGRFISMDAYQGSIYDPASLHKYTYTSGNSVMYQDVSGYSQNLISNAVGMAGKCILIEGETVYNAVVIGMFSAIVASITYAVSMAAAKLTMTLGTYMNEVCTANFTYITGAEKSIEDMIIIFPAAEVANDIEIFPETEQVPVWEILTVPPAKGIDVMITIPGTAEVPNGIIIDFPIPQSFGENVIMSEEQSDTGNWNKGSFNTAEDSLNNHYKKHGKDVGAYSPKEYLRKAEEFARTAKKGSKKSKVYGEVEGVIRYRKNGRYIDLAPDGSIISFGK